MTLTVPLAVRLATSRQDRHITRSLRDLTFRSAAPGGFASLTMSFDRPLHIQPDEIQYYSAVWVYGPDGRTVWEGRLEDPGRGVSGDGLVWDLAAVGPSAHAEDLNAPVIYVDRSVDRWRRNPGTNPSIETSSQAAQDGADPGWQIRIPNGSGPGSLGIGQTQGIIYPAIHDSGQQLARFSLFYDMGKALATAELRVYAVSGTNTASGDSDLALEVDWTTVKTAASRVTGTDWTPGRDVLFCEFDAGGVAVSDDDTWMLLTGLTVVTVRFNADGTEKTAGYTDTVRADEVVTDVLVRLCPRYDGTGAAIAATAYPIQSLAYPDAATAREIFEEMMKIEPAYFWAAWESQDLGRGAKAPIHVADDFNRTGGGGWRTSPSGHEWLVLSGNPANVTTNGTQGVHHHTAINTQLACRIAESRVDVDFRLGLVTMSSPFNTVTVTVRMRAVGADFVDCRLFFLSNGTVTLAVRQFVSGVETFVGFPTIPSASGPGGVSLHFQAIGGVIRAKAWWPQGGNAPEPADWTLSMPCTFRAAGAVDIVTQVTDAGHLPYDIKLDDVTVEMAPTSRHRFEWATWPTVVRYEAGMDDGFSSPGSGQGLYNRVRVRWRTISGAEMTIVRTQFVQDLAGAGLDREAFVDIGSDRTLSDAEQAGDAFLAEHRTPPNAGTLTVARPIVDLVAGGMVQPWEIRPGNLIRVRGVLPRVDSLNATDRDGVTVFRIVSATYRASSASAQLELDSYSLTVAQALAALKRGK